ncbi:MAG: AmpG family muropeptide MFS transporter [Pseudomonadota bacterium]
MHEKRAIIRSIFTGRMVVALIMGFASGLPLLLTMGVLQAWMREEGLDLGAIGLINLVQIPYTWKFLWAPIMDRFTPAILGRRRGWLIISQIALTLSIAAMAFGDPGRHLPLTVISALLVAFFSASQDIVVDAYRRETLSDDELGLGSSLYIYGYRLGMLLASGGGLIMADHMAWSSVYLVMAACMLPVMAVTLLAPEPEAAPGQPVSLRDAVIAPLADYFTRPSALAILAFILLYKLGDSMASAMTMPFYLDIGFTKTQVGTVVKIFGTGAVIGGAILGGIIMLRLGINRSLWIFGVFQAVSTAGFALLARMGDSVSALSAVIAFENISSGMGTAAFVAFMASITDKRFTATQYALLSSLMGIPRVLASAPTGYLAEAMGWEAFFIFCALIALPGMMLLMRFAPWGGAPAPLATGERS